MGGGGDCFFHCLAPLVGMAVPELRRCVAQHMRDNELIYGDLGDFEIYGGYHRYCDMVGTCGIYVEGNAEIAAAADFISRHLLILGADSDHDVYIFAGAIGLGEPVNLGVDESPIIIAHCRTTLHYTRTRIMIQRPWCAPKTAKRARIEELRLQNEIEANVKECARAAVITHARSLAEQARISLRKKEELNLPSVATDEPTPIGPIAAPSIADPLPAFAMPIFESTIDALSPAPSVPIVEPSNALLLPPPPPLAPIIIPSTAAHSPSLLVQILAPSSGPSSALLPAPTTQNVEATTAVLSHAPSAPTVLPSNAALSPAPSAPVVQPSTAAHGRVTGICPCCGGEGKKLVKRIGQGVMAVMISANRDFNALFEATGIKFMNGGLSIMVCRACQDKGINAIKAAKEKYPEVKEFKYSSSNKLPALMVKKKLTCGVMTMVQNIVDLVILRLRLVSSLIAPHRFPRLKVSHAAIFLLTYMYLTQEHSLTHLAHKKLHSPKASLLMLKRGLRLAFASLVASYASLQSLSIVESSFMIFAMY